MGSTLQVLCERRRYAKTREDPGGAVIEQPRVLNRDHCLVGKSGDQLYLLVGKGVHFIAGEYEDTDRRSLAQEGYAKDGSVPKCLLVTGRLVFRIGQRVGNMNCLAFQGDPPRHAAAIQL